MWCLVSSNGQSLYNVTPGKVHTVSRKNGDIILANDQSVSRKHAFLEVKYPITEGIHVWDESSKYGSFINGGISTNTRLESGKKYTLKEGGTVRFGLQDNIWTLKREVPCVLGLMLKPAQSKNVMSAISKTGGQYIRAWTKDITHLCTNTVRLTYEVMCALASAKPIVTPLFWDHYSLMLDGKGALADPAKFIPSVSDSEMSGRDNLCLPNAARKSLFKDKLFILPNINNFEELKTVIELAGGKVSKLSDCKLPAEEYCKPNIILLKSSKTSQETAIYQEILTKLRKSKWSAIPEEDIGLAIWKVSTEKHCNPAFSSTSILYKLKETSSQVDTGATLVLNTEDVRGVATGETQTNQTNLVIPPTLSETDFSNDATESIDCRSVSEISVHTNVLTSGSSRKRNRDSQEGSAIGENKELPSSTVKAEPRSPGEEDLFADILPEQNKVTTGTQAKNTPLKKPSHNFDDDDFLLPSPPKRKKLKKSDVSDDMFDLPEPPPSTQASKRNINDDFDLPSPRKKSLSLNSSKINKSANSSVLNESADLFESLETTSEASTSRAGKRKDRNDSESEDPPPKRPSNVCVDVTDVHKPPTTSQFKAAGFISKSDIKQVKKEEPTDEEDISIRLQTKVVLAPLIVKRKEHQNLTNSSNAGTVKNFKKFKKNWGGNSSVDRHQTTNSRVLITTTASRSRSSFSTNGNSEEDEDDPFSPERPTQKRGNGISRMNLTVNSRNNINQSDDEDDEFALPSFSQV